MDRNPRHAYELRRALNQAVDLRKQLEENLRHQQFEADDLDMNIYNGIVVRVAALLPDDSNVRSMELMPDANLQTYLTLRQFAPPAAVTKRLISRLTTLINHLEVVLREPIRGIEPTRSAEDVLREEDADDVKLLMKTIQELRTSQPANVKKLGFNFMKDEALRGIVKQDFVEAQLSFGVEAFKASGLLAASVLEGMLLDVLQSAAATTLPSYAKATASLPKIAGEVDWDRVSLSQLVDGALQLGLVTEREKRFVEGARDCRDTIHSKAELRQRGRVKKEEAELLLVLVELIHQSLDARLGANAS
jgi:hypothetical protein